MTKILWLSRHTMTEAQIADLTRISIIFISASDIAFDLMPVDPEDIYFFKMTE